MKQLHRKLTGGPSHVETQIRCSKPISQITVFVFVSLALLGLTAWRSSSSTKVDGPRVINQTTAFQVVGADVVNNVLNLTLRNVSEKTINGYSLALNGGFIRTDFTIGVSAIAPGQIEERSFPYDSSQTPEMEIQAVVFADRSFNGSIVAAYSILHRRDGLKVQLQAIDLLLKAALESSDAKLPANLDSLLSEVDALPEGRHETRAFRTGLHDAKSDLKMMLKSLMTESSPGRNLALRQRLNEVRWQVTERAKRL
ncbi:MAG: hypothetical protein AABN95_04525 [Acidobacteriota bacterium]